MDKIYVGNIPKEYCYARFADGHIDLYKNEHLTGYQDFYRIYMYNNLFQYEHLSNTFNQYTETTATRVDLTDEWYYRRDMPSIMFMSLIEICIVLILFNIVTSVFKRGGLLSGLL